MFIFQYGARDKAEATRVQLRRKCVESTTKNNRRGRTVFCTVSVSRLLCSVLFIILLSVGKADEWDDPCKDEGQCGTMMKSYESLVEGEACRSFYYTGSCPTICAFSLKSLVGRRAWTRCSRRCDWASAFIDAASSWLNMCLLHPRHDDNHHHNELVPAIAAYNSSSLNATADTTLNRSGYAVHKSKGTSSKIWMTVSTFTVYHILAHLLTRVFMISFVVGAISLAIFAAASFWFNLPVAVIVQRTFNFIYSSVRRVVGGRSISTLKSTASRSRSIASSSAISKSHVGVLETGRMDRPDLSSFHRGARRHLKSMHANLE